MQNIQLSTGLNAHTVNMTFEIQLAIYIYTQNCHTINQIQDIIDNDVKVFCVFLRAYTEI